MSILFVIFISILAGVCFFSLGRFIGNSIAKKQKIQDEVMKNGSKHI